MDSLVRKIEISRQELLDMGLRGNSLLHYRKGVKTLEVIDEISIEIFRILVTEHKAMSFVPVPQDIAENDEDHNDRLLPQIFEEKYGEKRHTDTRLQTKLTADKLDKKLLKISTEAVAYRQEQGVEILYLALGFLWQVF